MSFAREGFPALRLSEARENYRGQHQTPRTENGVEYGDWPKFVDFDYVANVARVNAATLAALASAPAPPANVKLETKQLQNDSTLIWQPVPGATGYEVLWRATDAPDWQNAKSVGNVDQATVPISKDNVIFAVRSVDGKGHKSLPAVPAPER